VSRPPRICILAESFYPLGGGVGTYGLALGRALIGQGGSVTVLTQRVLDSLPETETIDGIRIVRLQLAGPRRLGKYLMLWPGYRWLKQHRDEYDLIYVWGLRVLGVLGVLAAWRLGKPCVVRAEQTGEMSGEFIWQQSPPHSKLGERARGRGLLRGAIRVRNSILRRADAFVAISQELRREFLAAGVPADRIIPLPNAVDIERFRPPLPSPPYPLSQDGRGGQGERAELRRQLGLGDDFTFVFAGRLHRHKGLFHLLQAWAGLRHEPRIRLLLVGGDSPVMGCEAELKDLAASKGLLETVRFVGKADQVERYLKAADCFVLPSEREGFSIALLEAMASGLPAIATATSGTPELIHPGETGELVPIGDVVALRSALDRMRRDAERARRMGTAARHLVEREYAIETAAARHQELFRRLEDSDTPEASSISPGDDVAARPVYP
jgi:glycosyltransferase involved in cell wall biosynthesis